MSVPYDYDPSNIEHLRAVIAEQEQTIKYLHERCKAEEVENAKLRELLLRSYESFEEVYDRCDIDDSWRMETALEDMRVCMCELGVEVPDGD